MTCLLKQEEIVLHLPCVVLGDTKIFIQDKYRKKSIAIFNISPLIAML
jgi:hypothetical protein